MRAPLFLRLAGATLVVAAAATSGALTTGLHLGAVSAAPRPTGRPLVVPPPGRVLFGTHLLPEETPAAYVARSGVHPAVYGEFVTYALSADARRELDDQTRRVAQEHGDVFLTLEPRAGLAGVTATNAREFARLIARENRTGVRFYVRFGQEMNGGWYPWGQQPREYVRAFRLLADAVHREAPGNAMVWSPNYGGGYPFAGGAWVAKPGTADFRTLDTNHDGRLTMADDMYTPYYPGDRYVDWVGLTLYYFGRHWPWGANTVPDPNRFASQLTGRYDGPEGDERAVPDFYQELAVGHHKPMAISETSALYNTSNRSGASNVAIKSAWMDQVLAPDLGRDFPMLRMLNWFEHLKSEQEHYGVVDWRAASDPAVLRLLRAHLARGPFVLGPGGLSRRSGA